MGDRTQKKKYSIIHGDAPTSVLALSPSFPDSNNLLVKEEKRLCLMFSLAPILVKDKSSQMNFSTLCFITLLGFTTSCNYRIKYTLYIEGLAC